MIITDITVERTMTLNLGNFESARFGVTVTAHLTPDDDPDEAYELVSDMVMQKLQEDIDAFGNDGA